MHYNVFIDLGYFKLLILLSKYSKFKMSKVYTIRFYVDFLYIYDLVLFALWIWCRIIKSIQLLKNQIGC